MEIEARSQKISSVATRSRDPGRLLEPQNKLFVVSARLPFVVIYNDQTGGFEYEKDTCETNIADLLETVPTDRAGARHSPMADVVLVGSPVVRRKSDGSSMVISDAFKGELETYLRCELKVVPVFPPPHRERFADWMILPLFHYSLPSAETGLGLYDWEGYVLVSELFRDAVLKEFTRGDIVWINDYPLMLLPKLLRTERPDITVGFYLHCVFPSSEVYRILPQREEILRGVLSSNIIGFHTFQYVQHFLTSCIHVLGLECTTSGIEACEDAGGTHTKVITVPLGINLEPYQRVMAQEETANAVLQLPQIFAGKLILVAVDRLEEKKGIRHKIMAFHKFLQKAPDWATRCVYVQIVGGTDSEAIGDDTDGEMIEQLLHQVYMMVGEVNSKFGTIGHMPIHFMCREFSRVELVPLFAKAHIMIDTALRDVISHSAHAFLACQEEKDCGVLILSEFSGSAESLRAAALCVNPWDTNAFADAIQEAVEMSAPERVELHRYGKRYVNDYTLQHWATNFLDELRTAENECETERLQIPPQLDHAKPVTVMHKANRHIIVLGFSGTLLPHTSRAHTKFASKLPDALLGNLQAIAEDPNTHLVVITSIDREVIACALYEVPCWIIAEGGVCFREPGGDTWHCAIEQRDTEWLGPVRETMEYFAARTPGSTVCQMQSSVSWWYQKTQGDHAAIQSKDLLIHLWAGPLVSAPAEVYVEKESVTVRPAGVGKASTLEKVLHQICMDGDDQASGKWRKGDTLVVCVGDFSMRDEDIFVTLQKFFEPEDGDRDSTSHVEHWDGQGLPEREPHGLEELNLESNSKTIGCAYNRLSTLELDEGPFAFHKSPSDMVFGEGPMMKKVPSEPDLQVGDSNFNQWQAGGAEEQQVSGGAPSLFLCTVSRKATRASYHLRDTHDVVFLISQLARELRQTKQAIEG